MLFDGGLAEYSAIITMQSLLVLEYEQPMSQLVVNFEAGDQFQQLDFISLLVRLKKPWIYFGQIFIMVGG